ncbi:MAG: DUF523 domain-containing protein [Desulfobacteraceae bacterium]|nr:DUF523 domain-containing protein [Desulfobacteraceae bacterium]
MKQILISACLAGEAVRYDGKAFPVRDPLLMEWLREKRALPFCPEVAGGLETPRPPAEIQGGTGLDVLEGRARIVNTLGEDVTVDFVQGANKALSFARKHQVIAAMLKEKSPSCGSGTIYDGTFSGRLEPGYGVTAALFRLHHIVVFNETQIEAAARLLAG